MRERRHESCSCLERAIQKLEVIIDYAGGDMPVPEQLTDEEADALLERL